MSISEHVAQVKEKLEEAARAAGRDPAEITLCAATNRVMLSVDVKQIKEFQMKMLQWFDEKHPEIGEEIQREKVLTDEMIQKITELANTFKAEF